MGLIISRFRRKPSTIEQLEALDAKIQAIEKQGQWTDRRHKQVKARFLALSVGICLICAVTVYLHKGKGSSWPETIFYGTALLMLPLLMLLMSRVVSWYYSRNLKKNMLKLNDMRAQKKKIIEEVMDKETYKVAKQIIDKFGSAESQTKPPLVGKPYVPSQNVPGNTQSNAIVALRTPRFEATPAQLRQRQIALTSPNLAVSPTSSPVPSQIGSLSSPRISSVTLKTELPRPLTPINRSALDKIVDFLVSDGPGNRYALICRECHYHNGMALAEEFEYLSYHCAYCQKFNPSVKQRPPAPIGTSPRAILARKLSDVSSCAETDKEKYSDSDSDSSSDAAADIPPRRATSDEPPRSTTPDKPSLPSASAVPKPVGEVDSESDSKKQD